LNECLNELWKIDAIEWMDGCMNEGLNNNKELVLLPVLGLSTGMAWVNSHKPCMQHELSHAEINTWVSSIK